MSPVSRRWRPDWFLAGLVLAVALASVAPAPGARGGWLHAEILNKAGVALVFFLHGAGLSLAALRSGALRWPVHLLVQATTFVGFPLAGLALGAALRPWLGDDLSVGLAFLCAAPSTVSSSIALTAAAGGNVPAAVFNATASSLIGVFATPLWMSLVLPSVGPAPPMDGVLLQLVRWLLVPLLLGQFARRWLGPVLTSRKKVVQVVDRGTILLLVYTSFCDSVAAGVWGAQPMSTLLLTAVLSVALLVLSLAGLTGAARVLRFPEPDRIAAVLCGSQKSLAAGVPMAQVIFASHPGVAVILLPLMIYHPLQLIVGSALHIGRSSRAP